MIQISALLSPLPILSPSGITCGDVEEETVLMTSQLWYCLLLYLPSLPPGFLSSSFLFPPLFFLSSSPCSLSLSLSLSLPPSSTGELKILTKGDNNYGDDREGHIYAPGQNWVTRGDIIGRARGWGCSLVSLTINQLHCNSDQLNHYPGNMFIQVSFIEVLPW